MRSSQDSLEGNKHTHILSMSKPEVTESREDGSESLKEYPTRMAGVDPDVQAQWPDDLRLQDIVAKTARVNLRDTVRVLRAVELVYQFIDEDMARRLEIDLGSSIRNGSHPAPLHAKPETPCKTACQEFFHQMMEYDPYMEQQYDGIFKLDLDRFYLARARRL